MRYELYLLDADETLFDFRRAERHALHAALSDYGIDCGEDIFRAYHEINASVWKEYEQGRMSQDTLRVRRMERLFAEKNWSPCSPEQFSLDFTRELGMAAFLLPDAEEVTRGLASFAKLVLFTNGVADVQRARLEGSGLAPYFAAVCISEEVGFRKPDGRMLEAALRMADCKDKTKALVVGDSQRADIQCAINGGVDSCLYNPENLPVEIQPTYCIHSLKEIPGYA